MILSFVNPSLSSRVGGGIISLINFSISLIREIGHNGLVYGKLRACERGFSEGKSDASKQSN
ncbi:hypothetical protein AW14_06790 [Siansivirga zeaxanthinifaciens CC-SAMT-1]|uniref:Uncharacterized protein n=1 Tax=Siansivirga zeaxanthinifaciens CC-SAMT-1 TaxID=1454006 RepID=A0A0C5WAP3_9FLAO|nr:hypothetical protein AW14_06790 [Siansivirga zeaxanthinifaciens CC-SAMT-1]